jgi:pimeloyl-ACP methyl ester carboxylesterase
MLVADNWLWLEPGCGAPYSCRVGINRQEKAMRFIVLLALFVVAGAHAEPLTNKLGEWYFWSADKTQLYARTLGQTGSDPVVVLHGGYGAEHSYLLPAFEKNFATRQFVFFDQRGSLRSPAAAERVSMDAFVADLEQLRLELGVEQLTVVAHSMGTSIAYAYLAKHPGRVKNLVLVGPVYPFYPGPVPDLEMLTQLGLPTDEASPFIKALKASIESQYAGYERKADEQIKREKLDGEPANGMQRTARWRIRFASPNIYDIGKWREMLGGQTLYNETIYPSLVKGAGGDAAWRESWKPYFGALQRYKGKLTFIIGRDDFIDAQYQFWPKIFAQLPNAKPVVIPKAGHNIWIDEPVQFTRALDEALR